MTCNSTVAASTDTGVAEIASANSCRRPASRNARTAAVASDPTTAINARWRRPKARRRAISYASRLTPRGRGDGPVGSLLASGTAASIQRVEAAHRNDATERQVDRQRGKRRLRRDVWCGRCKGLRRGRSSSAGLCGGSRLGHGGRQQLRPDDPEAVGSLARHRSCPQGMVVGVIAGLALALACAGATSITFLFKHRGGGPRAPGSSPPGREAQPISSVRGGSRSAGRWRSAPGCFTSAPSRSRRFRPSRRCCRRAGVSAVFAERFFGFGSDAASGAGARHRCGGLRSSG